MEQKKHTIRYGSVCSGVEAATLAWRPLGWEAAFFAEVEPFPCAVLQQRLNATPPKRPLDAAESTEDKDRKMREAWANAINRMREAWAKITRKEPPIPNLGDFTKIQQGDYNGTIDVLVGGTPCQDLSIAGKREGFAGSRSCLALDFIRLAYQSGPVPWIVWENVPGALSANSGHDFATFLSMLSGCEVTPPDKGFGTAGFVCNARRDRYGLAWRVLDAQFTRVSGFPYAIPQRRRRLFIVGHFGSWESAAEVLLEPGRMSWPAPTRRKTRKTTAAPAGISLEISGGTWGGGISCYENYANDSRVTFSGDVSPVLSARAGTGGGNLPLVLIQSDLAITCTSKMDCACFDIGNGQVDGAMTPNYECANTLHCMHDANAVMCVPINSMIIGKNVADGDRQTIGIGEDGDPIPTLQAGHHHAVAVAAFMGGQGAKAGGIAYQEELAPTIKASLSGGNTVPDILVASINCQGGSGIDIQEGLTDTITAAANSSGNNLFAVAIAEPIINVRQTYTKTAHPQDTEQAQGFILTDIAKTLNCHSSPASELRAEELVLEIVSIEQDSRLCCYSIAENVIGRQAHNGGNGLGAQNELAYTLDTTGVQAVAVQHSAYETGPGFWQDGDIAGTLRAEGENRPSRPSNVVYEFGTTDVIDKTETITKDYAPCITATCYDEAPAVRIQGYVRRLLPVECERLMGFPDNWTRIKWNGKPEEKCPDAPRYKACGNSMCVNVMRWIGEQIQRVEDENRTNNR